MTAELTDEQVRVTARLVHAARLRRAARLAAEAAESETAEAGGPDAAA